MAANPSLYRQLSEPFPTPEAASAAIEAFWEELEEIRKKHKIPDVHMVLAWKSLGSDGQPGEYTASAHLGNELMAEPMAAYAYGKEQADRRERIASVVERASKGRKSK